VTGSEATTLHLPPPPLGGGEGWLPPSTYLHRVPGVACTYPPTLQGWGVVHGAAT